MPSVRKNRHSFASGGDRPAAAGIGRAAARSMAISTVLKILFEDWPHREVRVNERGFPPRWRAGEKFTTDAYPFFAGTAQRGGGIVAKISRRACNGGSSASEESTEARRPPACIVFAPKEMAP